MIKINNGMIRLINEKNNYETLIKNGELVKPVKEAKKSSTYAPKGGEILIHCYNKGIVVIKVYEVKENLWIEEKYSYTQGFGWSPEVPRGIQSLIEKNIRAMCSGKTWRSYHD